MRHAQWFAVTGCAARIPAPHVYLLLAFAKSHRQFDETITSSAMRLGQKETLRLILLTDNETKRVPGNNYSVHQPNRSRHAYSGRAVLVARPARLQIAIQLPRISICLRCVYE